MATSPWTWLENKNQDLGLIYVFNGSRSMKGASNNNIEPLDKKGYGCHWEYLSTIYGFRELDMVDRGNQKTHALK